MQHALKFSTLIILCILVNQVLASEMLVRDLTLTFESEKLAQRGEAKLGHLEIDARLQAVPESDRAGAIFDPARMEQLISDQLMIRKFAQKAIEDGVLDDPLVQAEMYLVLSTALAEKYRNDYINKRVLDDYSDQARELYLSNSDAYQAAPTITFSHILINEQEEAERKASDLLTRIQSGELFTDIALEYSEDPSVQHNLGRLADANYDELETSFREGIEAIETGQIGLVNSTFGWHVVNVEKRVPARQLSFEEVESDLKNTAESRHRQAIVERLMRAFYAEELIISEGGVDKILNRYYPERG